MFTEINTLSILSTCLFFVSCASLPSSPDPGLFITDYIRQSEYQFPFYTVVACGGREGQLIKTLSGSFKKFFIVRPAHQNNVSEWEINADPQGFILDMECPYTQNILKQASELTLLRRPYSWLLLTAGDNGDSTALTENSAEKFELKSLNLRVDSLLVLATFYPTDTVKVEEFYKIREHMDVITLPFGQWTPEDGLLVESREVMAYRRKDLRGTTIVATIVINHEESMNHLEDMHNKHHDSASRLSYAIISSMASVFNAKVDLIKTDTWGTFQNGAWNGMVADLISDKADVGCCPLFITVQRMEVVDYLQGTSQARTAFIATAPPLSYSSNLFTLPFSTSVWASSVGLIIVTSILLFITTKYEGIFRGTAVVEKDTLSANWSDIAMLNLGAICQQGCDAEPRGPSGRIVTIILYFSVMFLYVSYSASIVALLQSSDTSIKTIKDLLESPLQCGAENIPYQRAWFKAASDPVRRELYLKKIAPKGEEQANFLTIEEGIRKVRQGLYAFHVEASPGYQVVQQTFTETEKCGLQELPSFIQVPEPWIPLQKNSPFGEMFKIGIKIAREVGIESRTNSRLYTKKPPCSAPGSNFVSVGLMDCYHLFLILSYGIVSSMVLLVIEKLVLIRLKNRLERVNAFWEIRIGRKIKHAE